MDAAGGLFFPAPNRSSIMKSFILPVVLALAALTAAPALGPVGSSAKAAEVIVLVPAHREFVVGSFYYERNARCEADGWRDRGYNAEIFRGDGGAWHVRVWR
jgi:hypothetical protein